jgi:hypothetical protein
VRAAQRGRRLGGRAQRNLIVVVSSQSITPKADLPCDHKSNQTVLPHLLPLP